MHREDLEYIKCTKYSSFLLFCVMLLVSSCVKKSDILTQEEWSKISYATLTFNAKNCPNAIHERKDCDKKVDLSYDFGYMSGYINNFDYSWTYHESGPNEAILYANEHLYGKNFHYKFILKFSGKMWTGHYVGKYECYFNDDFNSSGRFRIYVSSWSE